MIRFKKLHSLSIFAFLTIGLLITACGPAAEKLNKEGNEAFAEEAYIDALAAYEAAQVENPELAEPYYNAANTLYREGAYTEAMMLMQEALKYTDADSLQHSGFYNQGNSAFNLEEWESAIASYTEALLRNPDDQEAKYNLELALQQMQQQQQEQEQEQEQQEENQEEQEDQSENGDGQEDQQQEQSEDGQDQQDQEQQDGEEQQDDQSTDSESEGDQDQNNENGQPQDGEESDEQESQSQIPQPGQRMTAEQARQLLAAIAQDTETLQERLGQIFIAPPIPPAQDW
jgi:tetratricopeptide (TPR) repeat protein